MTNAPSGKDTFKAQEPTDISNVSVDYTPPEYISELFTDLGIFTPAAVSDELIKYF